MELLTISECGRLLKLNTGTIRRWRARGNWPPARFTSPSGRVSRYTLHDLLEFFGPKRRPLEE